MDRYLNANAILSKFCRDFIDLKKDLPIRPSEMGVLNIIVQREGLFTPLMIAGLLEVSKPMITSHITVLEKKGYITRKISSEDKRSFYIIPTDKAKELVKTTSEKMNYIMSKLEKSIGADNFWLLITLFEKLNLTLKENL